MNAKADPRPPVSGKHQNHVRMRVTRLGCAECRPPVSGEPPHDCVAIEAELMRCEARATPPALDVEAMRITVGPNNPPHYTDGWNDALEAVRARLAEQEGDR